MAVRILVVEDEGIVAKDIESRLRRFGYSVVGAVSSGEDAIKASHAERPDLVLMDIMLRGELGGIAAAEHIKERLGIPVVFLTAYADEATLDRAKISEPFGYILKPFDERELHMAIEIALYRHGIERKLLDYIAARKRAEEETLRLQSQLLHAQKLESVGRLAGGVAHDFNNLLTAILGNAEMALESVDEDSDVRRKLIDILMATEAAASLTKQLLSFSRKEPLDVKVADLNDIVGQANMLLSRIIGENIQIGLDLSGRPLTVKADPAQIGQVIINLAINARDAMPEGGRISIGTSEAEFGGGRYALLTFSDTGVGMKEAVKECIFDPFFTTKENGTGLGLSTVYGTVTQHGGHIEVESGQGKGTVFKVYFPLEDGKADETQFSKEEIPRGTETILLVEDNDFVRNISTGILNSCGYKTFEAGDKAGAISLCGSNAAGIDLVITDMVLPDGSGIELFDRLRERKKDVKVLFMTGYSLPDIQNRLKENGHDRIKEYRASLMQKPFTQFSFAKKVREVLDAQGI